MDRVRMWMLVTLAGVALGCARLITGQEFASVGETLTWLGWWAIGSAVVAAALVIAWAFWREAVDRRKAQRAVVVEQLTDAAVDVVGRRPGGRTVRVVAWAKLAPRKIVVRFPKEHEPKGAAGRLARAVGDVDSGESGRGWDARLERVRHRYVLTSKPEVAAEDRSREEAEDRAVQVVKKALPGCKMVTVTEWDEAQHPTRIRARFEPSRQLSSERVKAAVVKVVDDDFPGRWVPEWDHENDQVEFRVRPELAGYVRRPVHLPPRADGRLMIRYGITEDGEVHAWDLDGTSPHALVIGPTGGGKTYCLRAMALDAISQGVTVYGADPKRIELMGLIGVPGVAEIATSPERMEALIVQMRELMEERYERIERREVTRKDLPPVLFILDEFFILRMRLNRLWAANGGKGKTNPVLDDVFEMLALARSARIHIAIGIQRPDAAFLDGPARDNVRHRAALTSVSPDGALMTFGSPDVGTDLPEIAGRATATSSQGPREIQVYVVPDPDPHLADSRTPEDQELLDALLANAPTTTTSRTVPQITDAPAEGDVPPATAELEDELVDEGTRPADADQRPADERPVFASEPDPTPTADAEPGPAAIDDVEEPPAPQEWDEVPAEQVMAGDVVQVEGEWVTLDEADFDPLDEEYVALEWADGALSVPADEKVPRARHGEDREAA